MNSEPDSAAPAPLENEPTVLDLFKSVTRDWRSFFNFLGSLINEERRLAVERAAAQEARLAAAAAAELPVPAEIEVPRRQAAASTAIPWRSGMGMLLALFAQLLLEPPGRRAELAVACYIFAIGLALWACFAGEWTLPPLRTETAGTDPMTVRSIPLLLSGALSVAAFFALGNDLFTWGNLALWLAAIGCFLWALWLRTPRRSRPAPEPRPRWKTVLWIAAGVALAALLVFFRIYRIGGIPSEPFSDHAEKILDVYEITLGKTLIFFPRNTGREAIQMYWTLLIARVFGTGFSFLSLKIGTALLGILTLPFVYLLGKELSGPRLGWLATFLFGVSYWVNLVSRIGLRFPLYPLFAAPTLLYLIRGLRRRSRNDFLLAGLFLGLGLHGYSPFRIVPVVVVAGFAVYLLHRASRDVRAQAVWWLALTSLLSLIVFLPLLRYWFDHPDTFSYRAISRMGTVERPLPGPAGQIFLSNLWNGLRMFNWDDGEIWVNSVPHRPALDVVTGALFLIAVAFVLVRYARRRDWRDLFMVVSIPILMMPSILSLAYPGENPAINRSDGAAIPVILLAAMALDGLISAFGSTRRGAVIGWGLAGLLLAVSAYQNYDLVFHQFNDQFRQGAWNTSEMGQVISDFRARYGETDTVWIVPFPYWVDTRLPGIWAGIPNRDFALFKEDLPKSLGAPFPKLFIYWQDDTEAEKILRELYPQGVVTRYTSAVNPSKDFMIFFVEK
ncbi:MAG: ArnT family glycosyltransferase [Bacteroidota bacterium]